MSTLASSSVKTRVFDSFEDPALDEALWTRLLGLGETNAVNMTRQCQRSWWKTFGRGKLHLVAAERDGKTAAIAPLFSDGGMIFNLCPEDHLDFVGDAGDPAVLDALLDTARSLVPDFCGFQFYFIPDTSRTGQRLKEAAARLGLEAHDENSIPCPSLALTGQQQARAQSALSKKNMRYAENVFTREAPLEVIHLREGSDILPHLDAFFDQHVQRRQAAGQASIFEDPAQREYYRRIAAETGSAGWLRFTRINWKGKPIAFHFGLCYGGRYLYGIPSFDVELARLSPGNVLLRQLILAAIAEGAAAFDFGIGDEAYKYRFATHVPHLHTWGLYPAKAHAAPRGGLA